VQKEITMHVHAEGVPATNADIHSEKKIIFTIIIYSSLKFDMVRYEGAVQLTLFPETRIKPFE